MPCGLVGERERQRRATKRAASSHGQDRDQPLASAPGVLHGVHHVDRALDYVEDAHVGGRADLKRAQPGTRPMTLAGSIVVLATISSSGMPSARNFDITHGNVG